jgi:hypothetical protein
MLYLDAYIHIIDLCICAHSYVSLCYCVTHQNIFMKQHDPNVRMVFPQRWLVSILICTWSLAVIRELDPQCGLSNHIVCWGKSIFSGWNHSVSQIWCSLFVNERVCWLNTVYLLLMNIDEHITYNILRSLISCRSPIFGANMFMFTTLIFHGWITLNLHIRQLNHRISPCLLVN